MCHEEMLQRCDIDTKSTKFISGNLFHKVTVFTRKLFNYYTLLDQTQTQKFYLENFQL